jgi:hypothetical protein
MSHISQFCLITLARTSHPWLTDMVRLAIFALFLILSGKAFSLLLLHVMISMYFSYLLGNVSSTLGRLAFLIDKEC